MPTNTRHFEFPFGAVSTNRIWRNWRGRTIPAPAYTEFKKRVAAVMFGEAPCEWEWVGVRVWLAPRRRGKFDVDNHVKSLFDALTACGFWPDDQCVSELTVRRIQPRKEGLVYMEVYPVEGQYVAWLNLGELDLH